MELQRIMWPTVGICTCSELYVRWDKKVALVESETMRFGMHGVAWFDTYFNGVSIEKWRKYTKVQNIGLQIEIEGSFKVTLYQKRMIDNQIQEQALKEEIFVQEKRGKVELEFPAGTKGMLFFCLEGLQAQSVFYGGAYITDLAETERREVKIGLVICTFRREEYIQKTIQILEEAFLNKPESVLKDKLEVFLSDNGKTLPEELATDYIHIFPNKNVGGSGGFTRGLMEILKKNQQKRTITHVLFMDDDVKIAPESILKTWQVLSLIKEEYAEAFLGGAMLRMDQPSIQVEAGASWNTGKLISLKAGLDLRRPESCLYNEVEEYSEFHAWWYCCFPIEVARNDNLPLPFFIRGDDVEYGLRNQKPLILINGICVWHEPFENKYSSFLNYYILRNQLIVNSLHCPQYGKKELKKEVFRRVTEEILFYRYRNVDLILRGVEDFLRGPEWLFSTDGEALHQEITAMGYRAESVEKLDMAFRYAEYQRSIKQKEGTLARYLRKISFNGYLGIVGGREDRIVSMANPKYCNVWRADRVMYYDAAAEKGFLTQRSWQELLDCYKKMGKVFWMIDRRYEKIRKRYRLKIGKLTNLSFWKKYLREDDKG